ncbi:MAG: hypothetical protein IJK60_04215 [Clostridia bacterium]|nr:hypothetical protein [Clostridia bacterium]
MKVLRKFLVKIICVGLTAALFFNIIPFGVAYAKTAGVTAGCVENLNGKNWMSGIPDERYIYEINLPGTHDSTTANSKNSTDNRVELFGVPVFNSGKYAKTQSLTLPEQLNAGVRYLDLRFSAKQGELHLCHGNNEKAAPLNNAAKILSNLNPLTVLFNIPFLNLDMEFYAYEDEECSIDITFDTVFAQIKDFLSDNPSETVIITAKKENGDEKEFLTLFNEQIQKLKTEINPSTQKEFLYTENGRGIYSKMPVLSEVRGKMILMTPFYEELRAGDMLDVGNKAGQTDFMGITFNYENHWSVTAGVKALYTKRFIEKYSTEMSKDPEKHLAYANVLKTNSSAVLIQTPYEIEKRVSKTLYGQNTLLKGRYYGWIMGDFMTEEKCALIWQTNYFVFDR